LNLARTDQFEGTMDRLEQEMAVNDSDRSNIQDKNRNPEVRRSNPSSRTSAQ
jgi:hypothetical protein